MSARGKRRLGKRSFKIAFPSLPQFKVLFYQSSHEPDIHRGWFCKVGLKTTCSQTGQVDAMFGQVAEIDFCSKKTGRHTPITRKKVAAHVTQELVRLFEHEIAETLRIDGRRAWHNPHRKARKVLL